MRQTEAEKSKTVVLTLSLKYLSSLSIGMAVNVFL